MIVNDTSAEWNKIIQQEKERKENRISRALHGDTGIQSSMQKEIAGWLYEVRYDNHDYETDRGYPTKEEVLDNFCWEVFGCNFEEVMVAYDKFLG